MVTINHTQTAKIKMALNKGKSFKVQLPKNGKITINSKTRQIDREGTWAPIIKLYGSYPQSFTTAAGAFQIIKTTINYEL